MYLMASARNVSERTLPYLLTQLQQAGAPVGQLCHNHHVVSAFLHVCSALRSQWVRQDFWKPPPNLKHPSAWRLIFDGFTMRNGATVTVVVIAYTNAEGVIATEFLGCTPPAVDSSRPACAMKIVELLEERLGVQTRAATCVSSSGLPTCQPRRGGVTCQPRRGGVSDVRRSAFLTSIPVDRAYCGRTGNKGDDEVGKRLGVRGLLGVRRRLGMADAFHCINGCVMRVF